MARNAIGGPILGILVGYIGSLWLRRIIRDDLLSSTATFVLCYILFYVAEFTFVRVSGILSIIGLGLFMSALGKTKIYLEAESSSKKHKYFIIFEIYINKIYILTQIFCKKKKIHYFELNYLIQTNKILSS